jgi:hypothetical protein
MQFSFSLAIVLILVSILPIFTLNKKFDLLTKFLITSKSIKFPKISVNLAFLGKSFVYILLLLKLYFSLYVVCFIFLNQMIFSSILAMILLFIILVMVCLFWNLKPSDQNLVVRIFGIFLASILSIILLIIFFIFLRDIFISIRFNQEFLEILEIFFRCFSYSIFFTFASLSFAKVILFFLSKIHNSKFRKYLFKFFYFFSGINAIFFCTVSFLVSRALFQNFFNIENRYIVSICIIMTYSTVFIDKIINKHFLTPVNIINKYKIRFFNVLIEIVFELNILIQFIFFLQDSQSKNIFYKFIYALKVQNYQIFFFIGFLYLATYLIFFIFSKKKILKILTIN